MKDVEFVEYDQYTLEEAKTCRDCYIYSKCVIGFREMDIGIKKKNLREPTKCHAELLEVIAKYCMLYKKEE